MTSATRPRAGAPRRRQREILDAAARVFHEKGYESTSIQDIADSVGILKGSLYYYIASKEDLLYEIIEGVHQEGLKKLERIAALEGTALQRVRAFVVAHTLHNAENIVRMGVYIKDFRSLSRERQRVIEKERDTYDAFLRDLIREGQRDGTVCRDLDAKMMAIAILGMLNWMHQWYRPQGEWSAAEIADSFADFVVSGLACDPDTHFANHKRIFAALPADLDQELRMEGGAARSRPASRAKRAR